MSKKISAKKVDTELGMAHTKHIQSWCWIFFGVEWKHFSVSSHCNFRLLVNRQKVFQNFSDKFHQIAERDHTNGKIRKSQDSIYIENFPKVHYRICIHIVQKRSNSFNLIDSEHCLKKEGRYYNWRRIWIIEIKQM